MQDYNPNDYRNAAGATVAASGADRVAVASFLSRVYGLMSVGLLITAVMAYFIAGSQPLMRMFGANPVMLIVLCVLEFGLVLLLTWGIKWMSSATAMAGFIAFAVLNGVTLSSLLIVYTGASIASTFAICAGSFAALSIFGAVTKKELSWVGSFCFIGLIGLILAGIVNIFIQSSLVNFALGCIGVVIFAGLTAYDTQMLKRMGAMAMDGESMRKFSIVGALQLYLDFINLFISLLQVLGNRR